MRNRCLLLALPVLLFFLGACTAFESEDANVLAPLIDEAQIVGSAPADVFAALQAQLNASKRAGEAISLEWARYEEVEGQRYLVAKGSTADGRCHTAAIPVDAAGKQLSDGEQHSCTSIAPCMGCSFRRHEGNIIGCYCSYASGRPSNAMCQHTVTTISP